MIAWPWLIGAALGGIVLGFCCCAILAGFGLAEARHRADNYRLLYGKLQDDYAALQKTFTGGTHG